MDHLQCDDAAERNLSGFVYDTHPAYTEDFQQFEPAGKRGARR
jgi:hypothetical protein